MTTDKSSERHADQDHDAPPTAREAQQPMVPPPATTRGCREKTRTTRSVRRRRSERGAPSSRVVLASDRCPSPALRAAGLEHRSLYAMRHTYASMSIAAGVSLFELSRLIGTSPAMIDKTYGHMLPDALARARSALNEFVWAQRGHSEEAADS